MNLFIMRTIYLIFIFMYTLNMGDLERVLTHLMEQGWDPWGIDTVDIDLFSVDFKWKNIHI